MEKSKTKYSGRIAAHPVLEPETIDKREASDLSEVSESASLGVTAKVARRRRAAQLKDDLIHAQVNRSFNDFLRTLPIDDFDRKTLELDKDHLVKRCERARTLMMHTQALQNVRKYLRLKAKIAVIDLMLSPEVAELIKASSLLN